MTIELNNNVYADGGNDTETTPVVLVHGFPVDHRMWDECAAALRDQAVKQGVKPFAIWAPDMPGAGEGPIPSDEDSGGKDADGAFPYGLDRMADAYVGLLHAAGYGKAIWVGLSMGGYGALRLALRYPGRYAAAASISGCVEMERGYETFRRQNPSVLEELDNVYGGERELLRGPGSLFGLADRFLKEPQRAPRMYMACGTEDFLYENGIADYIRELAGLDAFTEPVCWECERRGRDRADKPEYKVKLNIACCFSNKHPVVEHYHNSSFLEHGGSPEKATRLAFVYAIDKYLRDHGKYTKDESKITYPDVQDCLILVSNNFSTQTSYENQTKKSITNKFIQDAMNDFLREQLQVYFIENPDAAEKIASQVLINKRSRETAEKTRINQKKKLTEKIDIANRVQKFVDCRTKDVSKREIYIVEGDSALGACKQSRDAEFQGLMPVRGKILNCLKADYPRIFKSDIITDLMKVLGCGVEVSGRAVKDLNQFDLNNLRWSKVILCTDGDVDGFQIRTLILTMLYRLCPTLIREGYVYIAETPLFEITCKEKTWFAYSEKEKADILKSLEGKKVKVDRSKGLGENDPEMMWLTTMNPETRRLVKVLPDEAAETERIFDLLLGDNLAGRKEYIAENGYKYLDMIDVS